MYTYSQSTGQLTDAGGVLIGTGFSGHDVGMNNPQMQNVKGVGPLPQGRYTIGAPRDYPGTLGPLVMALLPDPANEMFDRSGFYFHGASAVHYSESSDGCIVLPLLVRLEISQSGDKALQVTA
jgi:hypothetical protein